MPLLSVKFNDNNVDSEVSMIFNVESPQDPLQRLIATHRCLADFRGSIDRRLAELSAAITTVENQKR